MHVLRALKIMVHRKGNHQHDEDNLPNYPRIKVGYAQKFQQFELLSSLIDKEVTVPP